MRESHSGFFLRTGWCRAASPAPCGWRALPARAGGCGTKCWTRNSSAMRLHRSLAAGRRGRVSRTCSRRLRTGDVRCRGCRSCRRCGVCRTTRRMLGKRIWRIGAGGPDSEAGTPSRSRRMCGSGRGGFGFRRLAGWRSVGGAETRWDPRQGCREARRWHAVVCYRITARTDGRSAWTATCSRWRTAKAKSIPCWTWPGWRRRRSP